MHVWCWLSLYYSSPFIEMSSKYYRKQNESQILIIFPEKVLYKCNCYINRISTDGLIIFRFNEAMNNQGRWSSLQNNTVLWFAYAMLLTGTSFVIASFWALGFTASFYGKCWQSLYNYIYSILIRINKSM